MSGPSPLIRCEFGEWAGPWPADICDALEQGAVLHFANLRFELTQEERQLVAGGVSVWQGKNISLDPDGKLPVGLAPGAPGRETIGRMMARFSDKARKLVVSVAPDYEPAVKTGRTSFRPVEIAGRAIADWRADDTRLHTDAFPATPMGGLRLLRVFANIDPDGRPRIWRIGGRFEDLAAAYLPRIARPFPGSAILLRALRRTRSRRSAYDHYMLRLHDMAKADHSLQIGSCQQEIAFGPSVWMVYSDQVPHAAMSGRNALETTFYLPPAAQRRPALSPLKVLERLTGRRLAAL